MLNERSILIKTFISDNAAVLAFLYKLHCCWLRILNLLIDTLSFKLKYHLQKLHLGASCYKQYIVQNICHVPLKNLRISTKHAFWKKTKTRMFSHKKEPNHYKCLCESQLAVCFFFSFSLRVLKLTKRLPAADIQLGEWNCSHSSVRITQRSVERIQPWRAGSDISLKLLLLKNMNLINFLNH